MYEHAKMIAIEKYGSINRLAIAIGVNSPDIYCAFNGTRPMYPKYKRLIAEALGEDQKELFEEARP